MHTVYISAEAFMLQEQQHHLMSSEALGRLPLHGLSEALLCLHLPSHCLLPLQLAASFCQDLGEGQILPCAFTSKMYLISTPIYHLTETRCS